MEINENLLSAELDFVGKTKKIDWFNSNLTKDPFFLDLLREIKEKRESLKKPKTTIRNILYSLFPASEFLFDSSGETSREVFEEYESWKNFVGAYLERFVDLAVNGTQGNIPQRAAVVIDLINQLNATGKPVKIIELGCSGGALGMVFENYQKLFYSDCCQDYFWLKKIPENKNHFFSYEGYDLNIPQKDFAPFFLWDLEKREKTKKFLNDFQLQGKIHQKNLEEFFKQGEGIEEDTFILTSYLLYQLSEPAKICDQITNLTSKNKNLFWLDLSKKEKKLEFFLGGQERINYLSLNGKQQFQAIDSSDDWANWTRI